MSPAGTSVLVAFFSFARLPPALSLPFPTSFEQNSSRQVTLTTTVPPPSSGGVALVEMLNLLEGFDLEAMGHNSALYLHLLTEAMRRAFADRAEHLGDPEAKTLKMLVEELNAAGGVNGEKIERTTCCRIRLIPKVASSVSSGRP